MTDRPEMPPVEHADVAREIARLERNFDRISADEPSAITAVVPRARASGDGALLGRSLCLVSRAQVGRGEHEAAVSTARAGLLAFDGLGREPAAANLAARAELLRIDGNALLMLGRLSEAIPRLEEAVRIAESAVARPADADTHGDLCAVNVLIRSLSHLGSSLFAVGELDAAIEVLSRASNVAADLENDLMMLDDVLLPQWNLVDTLHERARRRRTAGNADGAAVDVQLARDILSRAGERVTTTSVQSLTGYGRQGYYASLGDHFLLTDRPREAIEMFERQIEAISGKPESAMYDWVLGVAHTGLAEASLALEQPADAVAHSERALQGFDRHDEAGERAPLLLVRAKALRAISGDTAAYDALEAYHALRARLEADSAQRYAGHVVEQGRLERARAETESHRQIASTLETLGRIGQEITANLDADAVVRILHRHIGTLLHAPSFAVWLLEPDGSRVALTFGVEDGVRLEPVSIDLNESESLVARSIRERRELVGEEPDSALQSAVFVPLVAGARVLGALSVQSDRRDAYGENERWILRTICTYGAIAFDNAAAYRELASTVQTLQTTQHELTIRTAEFERLSMTDSLTGIPNRRHFLERASIEIAEARRNSGALGVAIFDIDEFKLVNDRYGHVAGDRVLQYVAHAAKDGLRLADFLARVGGEEFALLLPGAGPVEAVAIAERIRVAIQNLPVEVDGSPIGVTASFGVASFAPTDDSFDAAFARADSALYWSKQNGRNRVRGTP